MLSTEGLHLLSRWPCAGNPYVQRAGPADAVQPRAPQHERVSAPPAMSLRAGASPRPTRPARASAKLPRRALVSLYVPLV